MVCSHLWLSPLTGWGNSIGLTFYVYIVLYLTRDSNIGLTFYVHYDGPVSHLRIHNLGYTKALSILLGWQVLSYTYVIRISYTYGE